MIEHPQVVCISGPDGVGKTTQARMLVDALSANGFRAKYVWLRSSHILILPLLGLLKIMSRSKMISLADGTRIGFHDFRGSRLLRELYFAFTFTDLFVAYLFRVTLPRARGTSIIIDRNALDAAVDISISAHDHQYWRNGTGQMLMAMATKNTVGFVLMCGEEELRERRKDVRIDPLLHDKRLIYSDIAEQTDIYSIDVSGMSVKQVHTAILHKLQEWRGS